jgi:hypothetical protein
VLSRQVPPTPSDCSTIVKLRTPDRTNWTAVASPDIPPPTIATVGVGRPSTRALRTSRSKALRPMSSAKVPSRPRPRPEAAAGTDDTVASGASGWVTYFEPAVVVVRWLRSPGSTLELANTRPVRRHGFGPPP